MREYYTCGTIFGIIWICLFTTLDLASDVYLSVELYWKQDVLFFYLSTASTAFTILIFWILALRPKKEQLTLEVFEKSLGQRFLEKLKYLPVVSIFYCLVEDR